MPERVVLLHGFGGTRHAWDGVAARLRPERYLPLALDLPGHGMMAGERPITFAGCVAHDGRVADRGAVDRLSEATTLLRGVADGLSEMTTVTFQRTRPAQ